LPNSAEPRLNPEVTADPDQRVLEGFAARENSFGSSAPTDTPYETLTADQEAPQEQDAWKGLAAKEDFVELSDPIDNRHEIFAGKQENSQEQDAWEAPADQEPPFQLNKYSDDPYDKLTADPENSPGYDGLEAFAAIEDAVELSDPAGNRQEIYAADREITDHSESYAPVHFIGSRVAEPESQYTAHEFLEIAEREMTTTEGPETLGFTGQMKGAFVQEDMDQEGVLDAELSVPFTAQALFPLEETEEADPGPFLSEAGKDQEKSTAVDTQQSLF
ncbi:MAG: hypothetical protein LUD68_10030, partial [Rikenellaceae bacterium]|nr:hypothetical protein [Rikenellaceae bacterium]